MANAMASVVLASVVAFVAGQASAQCSYASKTAAEVTQTSADSGSTCSKPASACSGGSDQIAADHGVSITLTAYQGAAAAQQNIVQIAAGNPSFKTLVKLVQAAELAGALSGEGPFTVLAPTDEAFAKLDPKLVESLTKPENKALLQQVLSYHVIPAAAKSDVVATLTDATTLSGQRVDIVARKSGITIDGAKVVTADIIASNGVIHVIDRVLLPETKNLAEVAINAGSFVTLVNLVKAAGLAPALTGADQLTILAPTDEAFEAIGVKTISELLLPENKQTLAKILTSHVIPGRVYGDQVATLTEAKALSGQTLTIEAGRFGVSIGGARVLEGDIEASNGVIHVIDSVILPAQSN